MEVLFRYQVVTHVQELPFFLVRLVDHLPDLTRMMGMPPSHRLAPMELDVSEWYSICIRCCDGVNPLCSKCLKVFVSLRQ